MYTWVKEMFNTLDTFNHVTLHFKGTKSALIKYQTDAHQLTVYLDLCDIYSLIYEMKLVIEKIHNASYSLVSEGGVFTPEGYFL